MEITRAADVRAVLADPAFAVPSAPPADEPGGILWLRAGVSRFSNGDAHRRRRALASAELERLDIAALRRDACERATALVRAASGEPFDLMAHVARPVPVAVLAGALGLASGDASEVAAVARAYHPHTAAGAEADRAVARLVEAFGGVADEPTAARIGLLVQACDATAGLIGNAVLALLRDRSGAAAEEILMLTLRDDPPVRSTRRVDGDAEVTLDLTAARDEHLPFGAGPRSCPGREHALAIAAGVVEACRPCQLVEQNVEYEPSANLRMPGRLLVR